MSIRIILCTHLVFIQYATCPERFLFTFLRVQWQKVLDVVSCGKLNNFKPYGASQRDKGDRMRAFGDMEYFRFFEKIGALEGILALVVIGCGGLTGKICPSTASPTDLYVTRSFWWRKRTEDNTPAGYTVPISTLFLLMSRDSLIDV